jgi:hypothetical protein
VSERYCGTCDHWAQDEYVCGWCCLPSLYLSGADRHRDPDHTCCEAWVLTSEPRLLLRLLAACPATPVAGLAGYVDVRVPVDVWTRAREAGECTG